MAGMPRGAAPVPGESTAGGGRPRRWSARAGRRPAGHHPGIVHRREHRVGPVGIPADQGIFEAAKARRPAISRRVTFAKVGRHPAEELPPRGARRPPAGQDRAVVLQHPAEQRCPDRRARAAVGRGARHRGEDPRIGREDVEMSHAGRSQERAGPAAVQVADPIGHAIRCAIGRAVADTGTSSWIPCGIDTLSPVKNARRNTLLHSVIVRVSSAGRQASVSTPGAAASSREPGLGSLPPAARRMR